MTIVVRCTRLADWSVLKHVRLAALRDAPMAFGVSHAQALGNTDGDWQTRAAGKGPATFYLAFDGDSAIGMAAAVAADEGCIGLIAMWVAPDWRGGANVAGRLVDAVKAHAVSLGAREVTLEVAPSNARAVAFYQRQGFVFQAHTERLASFPEVEVRRMRWLMQEGGLALRA